MRRVLLAMLVLGLLGAQALADDMGARTKLLQPEQAEAIAAMPQVSGIDLDDNGVPQFITGHLGYLGPGAVESAALEYLTGIGPAMRASGREEFVPTATMRDELGQVHVRFQQFYHGLPVVGAEFIIHADEATGEVRVVNGKFLPDDGRMPTRPRFGSRQALEVAAEQAGIESGVLLDKPKLTYIVIGDDKPYLAWVARVSYIAEDGERLDRLFADALTGELVAQHGLIYRALNRKIYNGNHTNPDTPTLPGTFMFGEGTTSNSDAAAWDCYTNFGYTYNYYKTRFNRDSFDNAGAALTGTVHVGTNWVNAYWNGSQMVFGDGDGTQATYLSKALDVVAHELTHAVTQRTANLTYSNESGALNEAMSDIFAAGTEVYKDGSVNSDTWKIGEDCWTPATAGDALRYMNNPTADGQSYDYYPERYTGTQDYGGVHLNSGIANLAFYLVSQGGTHPRSKTTVQVPAIGITKAEQIFYRALTVYMTSSTNFQGARNNTAQAAQDLYTQTEVNAVQATWSAVGAPGGPVTVTPITNGQTVSNLSAAKGNWLYYKIAVPSGQSQLQVKTTGGTGDGDLYVKLGGVPTTTSNNGKSENSQSAETVTITSPTAGDWYIGFYAYAAFSGVSLTATYSGSTPTFTLSVSPTTVTITKGSSGTVTVTTAVSGGFNNAVALSASGAPSGASVSFSPTSIAAPGSGTSTMTINTGTAVAGTSTITVTGTGGGLTKTATVFLTVSDTTTVNETESNNTTGTANTISSSGTSVKGYIGSSTDVDYFKVSLPAGKTLTGNLKVPSTKDYDLYFYNSSGTKLASGTNSTGVAENVTYKNSGTAAMIVYIKVVGYNGAYSATLSYTLKATW